MLSHSVPCPGVTTTLCCRGGEAASGEEPCELSSAVMSLPRLPCFVLWCKHLGCPAWDLCSLCSICLEYPLTQSLSIKITVLLWGLHSAHLVYGAFPMPRAVNNLFLFSIPISRMSLCYNDCHIFSCFSFISALTTVAHSPLYPFILLVLWLTWKSFVVNSFYTALSPLFPGGFAVPWAMGELNTDNTS